MVFQEPSIKNFVKFSKSIFSDIAKNKFNKLYIIDKTTKTTNNYPQDIAKFINAYVCSNEDIEIKNFLSSSKNIKTIVFYNKKKYKEMMIELGSVVASKIEISNWILYSDFSDKNEFNFALGWGLQQYRFKNTNNFNCLSLSKKNNTKNLISILSGIFYGKELINIPSSDMGPDAMEKSFINFADYYNVNYQIYKGSIIREDFPLIYAVGKASKQEPRLLEMDWKNNSKYPLVILVGKGVCFDTGGLNLKPAQYMRNMKKDMGGAASVLSLANIIISSKLKINLKVLIPTVDNDIGSGAMRPGDVYNSRSGIKVEIGNTDAEGRLILADTLNYADDFNPKLLIDFATLTGAARVALGPDLPAYFTNVDKLSSIISLISMKENDYLWRMPLWQKYDSWLKSEVADICNISKGSHAGCITAALFLNKFVRKTKNWIHIDTYAWSDNNSPGHSIGGDILGVRTIFKLVKKFVV